MKYLIRGILAGTAIGILTGIAIASATDTGTASGTPDTAEWRAQEAQARADELWAEADRERVLNSLKTYEQADYEFVKGDAEAYR